MFPDQLLLFILIIMDIYSIKGCFIFLL